MALNHADWQIQLNKAIRYIGPDHGVTGANYVTVLELHRFLQDLADNASVTNDDFLDITTVNPSDKKFDTIITLTNGYTLDDAHTTPASEFIYGGSIIQGTGGTEAIYDGISVVGNRGVLVNVIQNGAILQTSNKFWNETPFGETFPGLNADPANGVAMRFMVLVRTAGADIDNSALIFTTREWGKTYSEFRIPSTGRGVNVVPLTFVDDLNNTTVIGTVAGWTTITNVSEGFNLIDVNQDTTDEEYYSEWNRDTFSINEFYERMKWLTRNGETANDIYGLDGELFRGITHEIAISTGTGTWAGAEVLTWTGGSGQLLAVDNTAAASANTLWLQLLTGVPPTNAQVLTGGTSGATATASGAATERPLSTPFCGASTGTSLVGAYGFSLEYADLAVNDRITALDGTTRAPPNNVTFTVNGILSGWRVLVGPEDGAGGLDYDQLSNTNLLNGAAVTTVTVDEAIPANTPATGTIRIERTDGSYTRHPFSARSGAGPSTFTITTHDFSTNTAAIGANVFISYIDDASAGTSITYNTVQVSTQTLFVESRFGGTGPAFTDSIKPARTTGTLGATGGSATISAVSDE